MKRDTREGSRVFTAHYHPIGTVRSSVRDPEKAPRQPRWGGEVRARVVLRKKYAAGLRDLAGFSHVVLVAHLHLSRGYGLSKTRPPLDDKPHGVFATRSPRRPNPIGVSVTRLEKIRGGTLWVRGLDFVDGTPILDIKPYIPSVDSACQVRIGWLKGKLARYRWGRGGT